MGNKDRIKNIAIIVDSVACGGAEKVASLLSVYLGQRGYNVYLLVDRRLGKKEFVHAGKVVRICNLKTGNFWIDMYCRAKDIKKVKQENQIDCSISFMEDYNFANVLSRANDKVIVSVRTYLSSRMDEWQKKGRQYRKIIPILYNMADQVVAVTNAGKEDLIQNFGVRRKKICVIPNPIDRRGRLQKKTFVQLQEKAIVVLGRHEKVKAQWQVVRAMKAVLETESDAHLYLVGEGGTTGYLKRIVKALHIEEHVHFEGYCTSASEYLFQARVFVLPSQAEGFPNVILDAFACGVPVISTDCLSGPREILAPGTEYKEHLDIVEYAEYGILVPKAEPYRENISAPLSNSELKMAEALIAILHDDALYKHYSKQSRKRADNYGLKKVCKMWEEILDKV